MARTTDPQYYVSLVHMEEEEKGTSTTVNVKFK